MKVVSALKAAMLAGLALVGAAVPQPAQAQLFLYDPDFRSGPIEPSDPLVGLALPGATPAEYRAHLVWNLRSGLNVAALQCQFSPYLRTVDNYNGILAHHARELAAAYSTLEGYFRRVGGRNGSRVNLPVTVNLRSIPSVVWNAFSNRGQVRYQLDTAFTLPLFVFERRFDKSFDGEVPLRSLVDAATIMRASRGGGSGSRWGDILPRIW